MLILRHCWCSTSNPNMFATPTDLRIRGNMQIWLFFRLLCFINIWKKICSSRVWGEIYIFILSLFFRENIYIFFFVVVSAQHVQFLPGTWVDAFPIHDRSTSYYILWCVLLLHYTIPEIRNLLQQVHDLDDMSKKMVRRCRQQTIDLLNGFSLSGVSKKTASQ